MALLDDPKPSERYIRGTARVNSRVPVAVEWTEDGRVLRAEGYTKDIGPKGCLVVVPQGFVVGQHLRVINLVNQLTSQAVLAWRGHEGPTGWEIGLELQNPDDGFWGLDF